MSYRKCALLLVGLFTTISYQQILAQTKEGWIIEAKNIDPNNYYGITLGNGIIGLVSSPEPLKVKDVVLNGAFDRYGRGRVSNILKGFNFVNMILDVDGQRISRANITAFTQSLDMEKAILQTTFKHGNKISVKHEMMALRHLPYSSLVSIEITALQDVEITPASVIEAPEILHNVRNYYALIDRPHVKIPLLSSVGQSPTGKHTVAASNSFIFADHENPTLIHEDWDYGMHLLKFKKQLKKGQKYTFHIVGSVCSTEDFEDPHNEAERLTIYAMLEGKDRLLQRHSAAWKALWESDIIIEGDVVAQRDVRSALYHLYSFSRAGTSYSLSPMGLSGLGYNGHVFWDTELWMYPPLLVLQPEIAKSLLEYRFQRLKAAKKNAFSHGYKGAMFPWESDDTGQESTPVWALTGPFQHHITGCVGWAFWKYYQVTKDKNWLEERGYPMLKEVADFWASRVEKGYDGKYHINNVVAADEWAENVDDDAFTNGIAIEVLRYATQAAQVLGITPDPTWTEVADNIVILSMKDGVTREHATYNGEVIKQADVNLLSYPLHIIREPQQIEKDLKYYEQKMAPDGPAMAHAILSLLYARMGNSEKAYSLFVKGYKPNEVPPFGVMAETAGGTNPYFATGAGGMLQALMFGFGGLEITDKGVEQIKPLLPKSWKSITIKGVGVEDKVYQIK